MNGVINISTLYPQTIGEVIVALTPKYNVSCVLDGRNIQIQYNCIDCGINLSEDKFNG